jgi:hypothetical protein
MLKGLLGGVGSAENWKNVQANFGEVGCCPLLKKKRRVDKRYGLLSREGVLFAAWVR